MIINCYDQSSDHSKTLMKILWFSTEISWDSCPVHYLWSCFYYEFHYVYKVHDQDSGHSKNYGGNFMIQYWNIMRLMSGSLFMKFFLLWISLWNVYKVHDQDSGHKKNFGGNFMIQYWNIMTHVRFIIYEVFFTMNFTMKCLLSAWPGFRSKD